jgi:type IV pilus assembly protein PilP
MWNARITRIMSSLGGMVVLLASVGGLLLGCQQEPPAPAPPAKVETTEPPPPTENPEEVAAVEGTPTPSYTYDPTGRREPFESLVAEVTTTAQEVIITPPPEELTSPLQKYNIKEIKVTGIILGGLGDYARVTAPDGNSYTINVGTLIGNQRGKVISITENAVVVKEIVQYESGTTQEIETPLLIKPEEEKK